MLNHVFKDFVRDKGRDNVEEAMRMCQKSIEVMVLSKMDVNKFQGSEDSVGHKAVTLKFNSMMEAVELAKSAPFDTPNIKIDGDQYTVLNDKNVSDEFILSLLLSSING